MGITITFRASKSVRQSELTSRLNSRNNIISISDDVKGITIEMQQQSDKKCVQSCIEMEINLVR